MKKVITLIFALFVAQVAAAAQSAPDAKRPAVEPLRGDSAVNVERIIEKYLAAQGEGRAIKPINSYVMRGIITIPSVNFQGTIETYGKRPDKRLTVVNLPGRVGQLLEGFDGGSGWGQRPLAAAFDVSKDETSTVERDNPEEGIQRFRDMFSKLVLKGKATVGLREAYVVEATPKRGRPEIMYFDAQTGYLLRIDISQKGSEAREMPGSATFGGFAKVNGIVMPTVISQFYKDFTMTVRLYEVKFNIYIDDSLFKRPKGPDTKQAEDSEK